MTHAKRTRIWGHCASAFSVAMAIAPVAAAQPVSIVDFGTDQPTTQQAAPPVVLANKKASSTALPSRSGDAVQEHLQRVQTLSNLSGALNAVCTSTPSTIDKSAFERAVIRALALRKGLAEIEQREMAAKVALSAKSNDVAARADLNAASHAKTRLLADVRKEVAGRVGDNSANIASLRGSLCSELCAGNDTASSPVNLCAFSSQSLAHAAVISDMESVRALARYVGHRFDTVSVALSNKQTLALSEVALAEPTLLPEFAIAGAASRILESKETGIDVAAVSMEVLDRTIRALGNFVVDRAKRESIVWFLRRMQDDVCGLEVKGDALGEIRAHWLPTTCALAGGPMDPMQYGGADLVRTLRGAISADVGHWPASAIGLGMGATLWADAKVDASLFSCDLASSQFIECDSAAADYAACQARAHKQLVCSASTRLRDSGAELAKHLVSGANASLAFYNFAADVDRINKYTISSSPQARLFSERLELFACAAALPQVFQEYGESVRLAKLGRVEETKALLLAALTASPACFSILGRGFARDRCAGFSDAASMVAKSVCPPIDPTKPQDARANLRIALQSSGQLEKLSTILRWAQLIELPARDLTTRWTTIVDASAAYRNAADAIIQSAGATNLTIPSMDPAHAESWMRLADRAPKLRVARAGVALARASLDLGLAFLSSTQQALATQWATGAKPGMFSQWYEPDPASGEMDVETIGGLILPGFGGPTGLAPVKARTVFVDASREIRRLADALDMIDAVFADDWSHVVASVVASMRADIDRLCTSKQCIDDCKAGKGTCAVVGRLGRYGGLFASLAFETDPDRIIAAIDAAASPVGGYRRKNIPDAFTVSLGSFVGLSGGTELRFGSYGGRNETGRRPYFAAPTLTLPIGVDFAKGFGSYNLGVFVSAIDPAAYLQYDVATGGKLPGAQLVTALAPGAWLHMSLFDSPFTLGLYSVFRPGLRAESSALTLPSAHALQFGLSASVDVTLFELFTKAPASTK